MEPDSSRDSQTREPFEDDTADELFENTEPSQEQSLEDFVRPFYSPRDTLYGLPHLRRVLKKAHYLARYHAAQTDMTVLLHAAYLHGLIYQEETRIRRFLQGCPLTSEQIERILQAAREAHAETRAEAHAGEGAQGDQPQTLEGQLLHDARLLEGGRTFLIASALMQGAARGQTLEEVVAAVEEQMLGRFQCYLPEAQRLYADKEAFARAFLDDLTPQL